MQKRSRRRRITIWIFIGIGAVIVVAGALALASNLIIAHSSSAYVAPDVASAPEAQAAIVLGAGVHPDGTLSPMLADRMQVGVELYKAHKVKKLLLSGDHGRVNYDEVNAMLRYATDRGVPDADIFTDHAGFSTYDTMYRARDVFRVKSAIVVTQGFHLARAVYTARAMGLEATGVAADLRPYSNELRVTLRDWVARTKAFVYVKLFKPKPRFLGPVIPIDGDGRVTRG
jgi:SanA protein